MLCIEVKYHGPTNHRGSRFTATIGWEPNNCRVTVPYDYASSVDFNEERAARLALAKFDAEIDDKRDWTVQPCGQHPKNGAAIYRAFVA